MKKYIIVLFLVFILSSCFGTKNNDTVSDLKEEILSGTENNNSTNSDNSEELKENQNEDNLQETEEKEVEKISQKYLTEEKFIEFDNFDISDFESLEKEITGKTLVNVDKIIVNFSNSTSDFPNDSFQLTKFKPGDKTFLYRAFKKYETLDYGENIYVFEAYSGDTVSKLELKVNVIKEEKEPVSLDNLPEDSVFGSPREIGNGNITYTDVKGLEIENIGNIDLKLESDSVTNYLTETLNTWFYWNTLRNIKGENGISFYVVYKDEDKYKYEKHYYNGSGLYGILELESGELKIGEDDDIGDILKEKNKELLEKNDDYTITSVSDSLFKKLTN